MRKGGRKEGSKEAKESREATRSNEETTKKRRNTHGNPKHRTGTTHTAMPSPLAGNRKHRSGNWKHPRAPNTPFLEHQTRIWELKTPQPGNWKHPGNPGTENTIPGKKHHGNQKPGSPDSCLRIKCPKVWWFVIIFPMKVYSIVMLRYSPCSDKPKYPRVGLYIYIYIHIESVLLALTVSKQISPHFEHTWFWVVSFVQKIVLFGGLLRAKNRAFWWPPSCKKWWSRSCFLVASFVQKIVLFGGLLRAKNGGLDRAFWWPPSCKKSCFSVALFVQKIIIVLFGGLLRAKKLWL